MLTSIQFFLNVILVISCEKDGHNCTQNGRPWWLPWFVPQLSYICVCVCV